MEWIIFFTVTIFFIYMWRMTRDLLFPGCIFNFIWIFVSILYIGNFGGMYDVKNQTYILIYIGLISVNIPYIYALGKNQIVYRCYGRIRGQKAVLVEQKTLLLGFQLLLLTAMIPFTVKMIGASDNLALRRQMYASNTGSIMSGVERLIYIYFGVFPGISAQMLLVALLLFKGKMKKSDKMFHLSLSIILILMKIIADGGRMVIIDTGICFFLAICFVINWNERGLDKKDRKKQQRLKRRMAILVGIAAVGCVLVTISRASNVASPIKYALRMAAGYYSIGPRLFERALENPQIMGLDKWTLGGVFLGGLLEIPRSFFAVLGIKLPSFFTIAQQELATYFLIGENMRANAFPTMFYYFMKDWGYIGIFIGSFIVGAVSLRVYRRVSIKTNIVWYFIYNLFLIVFAYGMCWWPLYRPEYFSACIYTYFIAKLAGIKFINIEASTNMRV